MGQSHKGGRDGDEGGYMDVIKFWMDMVEKRDKEIEQLKRENERLQELVEQYADEELSRRSHDVDTQF